MKSTSNQSKFVFTEMESISVFLLIMTVSYSIAEAQVVSHELRRLAISTNQFGIDTLKALDRIEPPDKVLVFCPACLSSSLMMIMMGSSKYQVVSALRHALYVWSMKPQDINKGFKDIFEHLGLNQDQQTPRPGQGSTLTAKMTHEPFQKRSTIDYGSDYVEMSGLNSKTIHKSSKNAERDLLKSGPSIYLSLPKLIRLREYLDRSDGEELMSWSHINQKSENYSSRVLKEAVPSTAISSLPLVQLNNVNYNTIKIPKQSHRETSELSQMSAISNVYIQRGLAMNYNYNLLLRQYYKTVIHPVDFIRNGEETRQHINSLVAANTEGKIKDLVGREIFGSTSSPRIMMISTFHFRGVLDIQLKGQERLSALHNRSRSINIEHFFNQTVDSKQRAQPRQSFIETEETLLKHGQFLELGCSVIEIPFNNRLISLVIVMSNHHNYTELLLTKLSAQVLSDMINSLVVKKISIEIPVIKFDRGPINVEGMIQELGLSNLFFGDKIYTSETGLNKWLRPSDIVHETSIDIGTINPRWGQPEDRLKVGAHLDNRSSDLRNKNKRSTERNHIKLDKPFFYFVFDSINGLVLTMGRIRQ